MNQASALASDGDKDPMPIGRATPSGTLVRIPRRLMRAALPDDEVLDSPFKCDDMRIGQPAGQPAGNGSLSFLRTAPETFVDVEPGVWNAQVLVSINNLNNSIADLLPSIVFKEFEVKKTKKYTTGQLRCSLRCSYLWLKRCSLHDLSKRNAISPFF